MRNGVTINVLAAGGGKIFKKDRLIKFLAIPMVAIGIIKFTGLIKEERYSGAALWINYLYFILVAWTIWEGNVQLMILLKTKYKTPLEKYYRGLLLLYVVIIAYTAVIGTIGLTLWAHFSGESPDSIARVVVTIVFSALLITNVYEIFYLKAEQADTIKRAEQLNIAKTHAELIALKNHIDPHFIFNSLNTLSYLISKDPCNARLYNDTLAKVYRYILLNRESNLVHVREEIEFLSNYFYLVKIRFGKAIDMIIEIESLYAEELFIPPISLQILLENAIKHNELSEKDPLVMRVHVTSASIIVVNKIIRKTYAESTAGTGLTNLDNRYKLITNTNISVQKTEDQFIVRLPILND